MKILLDTNALLWMFSGNDRLGATARGMIVDQDNEILVSTVSFWEIALKARTGNLRVDTTSVIRYAARGGLRRLDIEEAHLPELQRLLAPKDHRDPFDHLLIAQAIAEDAAILTADHRFPSYPVRCFPCGETPTAAA